MIDRLKENWDAIKDTLKENYDISKVSYDTWIVPMEIHNVDNDQVYILADTKGIPNILDYIKKKYKQILEIVKIKMSDMNARDEEAAIKVVAGTARSMGIDVVG